MTPRRPAPVLRRTIRSRSGLSVSAGFTLIELLTVIAIIALLAGILFPVFSAVRENARRATTMSNLREIYLGVKNYHLDNRTYPEFLFGPAVDVNGNETLTNPLPMKDVAAILSSTAKDPVTLKIKTLYARGLFPEYVKTIDRYTSPNNRVASSADSTIRTVTRLEFNRGTGKSEPRERAFYAYDAFDSSPAIVGDDEINTSNFYPRYSLIWTEIDTTREAPDRAGYNKQLMWRAPPEDTYLTMTTHHVPNGKAIVVWLNGTTKALDVTKLKKVENGSYETSNPYNMYLLGVND